MPPKRRGKKATAAAKRARSRKEKDPLVQEKKLKLESLLAEFDRNVESRCDMMKSDMVSVCRNIQLLYDMALMNIPLMYRKMTKKEYEEVKSKNADIDKAVDDDISNLMDLSSVRSKFESCLATTAKKKEKRKKFISGSKAAQRKSLKGNISRGAAGTRATRRALAEMQETVTPVSRQQGLPVNFSPKMKKSVMFKPPLVTPKFDPRKPLISSQLRKPKAGEIIMSMSGSPLLVPSVDIASKPGGVMVSLGGGRILNISEPSGISGINMSLDQSTKQTLKLVNEKLSKVLAS